MLTDRHHLLEIILWPNGDGTFKTILNSPERLQQLGIYNDYKLTIPLSRAEHNRLHKKGKHHSDETKRKMSKAQKVLCFSDEHRQKLSEVHKGKVFSVEHRAKLSAAFKGKHWKLVDGKRVWYE